MITANSAGRIQLVQRRDDPVAQALAAAQVLADDRADDGEDDADLHAGEDVGQRALQLQVPEGLPRSAFRLRMTSRCPGSTDRTPSCTLSMIGKNAISAAMMIFELMPKPNQMTNSGMSATLGTTWEATMSGRQADLESAAPCRGSPRR